MDSKLVVSGEASETESEDETSNYTEVLSKAMTSNQGEVITGEDSESDSETEINLESEDPDQLSVFHTNKIPRPETSKVHETLLIKKLRENNRQVYKDIQGFSEQTISEAIECLNGTEQELLKSQITLQGALTALRTLNNNSCSIRNKLKDILQSNFFPNVKKCCN